MSNFFSSESKNFQERIASLVIDTFENLSNKYKPQENEWTCLAAIIASSKNDENDGLRILTIASGNKCLGASKMCPNGSVVNDSHAEVLARRALKLLIWKSLLHDVKDERGKVYGSSNTTGGNDTNAEQSNLFYWKNDASHNNDITAVDYHLFISELPCGDASIILTPQNNEIGGRSKNIFKRTGAKVAKLAINGDGKMLKNNFNGIKYEIESKQQKLGVIRSKSGRSDLRPCDRSTSMSCSDKIVSWFFGGLQGSLLSHFIKPIYLKSIIVGHHQLSGVEEERKQIINAKLESLNRAIVGRLSSVYGSSNNRNSMKKFHGGGGKNSVSPCVVPSVYVTPISFKYSRDSFYNNKAAAWVAKNATADQKMRLMKKRKRDKSVKKKRSPAGNSMYSLLPLETSNKNHFVECLIAARGIRQGASKKTTSKKTWSRVSKHYFLEYFHNVIKGLNEEDVLSLKLTDVLAGIDDMTYKLLKDIAVCYKNERDKLLLDDLFKSWIKGGSYENFKLVPEDKLVDVKTRS